MEYKIEPGQIYKHHKGGEYTIIALTNLANPSHKFPATVVYLGRTGNLWSRPMREFTPDKFQLVSDMEKRYARKDSKET